MIKLLIALLLPCAETTPRLSIELHNTLEHQTNSSSGEEAEGMGCDNKFSKISSASRSPLTQHRLIAAAATARILLFECKHLQTYNSFSLLRQHAWKQFGQPEIPGQKQGAYAWNRRISIAKKGQLFHRDENVVPKMGLAHHISKKQLTRKC